MLFCTTCLATILVLCEIFRLVRFLSRGSTVANETKHHRIKVMDYLVVIRAYLFNVTQDLRRAVPPHYGYTGNELTEYTVPPPDYSTISELL